MSPKLLRTPRAKTTDGFGIGIMLQLTERGRVVFAAATRANVGRQLAIVIDGKPLSAPTVREPIEGGTMQITGAFTREEADALAAAILAHRDDLPLHLERAGR